MNAVRPSRPGARSRGRTVALLLSAGLVLEGCMAPLPSGTAPTPGPVQVLVTSGDRSLLLAPATLALIDDDGARPVTIEVDATETFQTFDGVGAAMTDSSAWLIAGLADGERATLMAELFGEEGARLGYVRVPLSSSDFALEDFTYDDVPAGGVDPQLDAFSFERADAHLVPMLQQARAVNPDLRLMGSAWSAPGWMKEGNDAGTRKGLVGGTLAEAHLPTYATYLRRLVDELDARGLGLDALTMQNEPAHVPDDYPGMLLSADQEARLSAAVRAELDAAGHRTKVVVHDHNWSLADRALEVLGHPAVAADGAAFHCYGGEPGAQSALREAHPAIDLYFTECSGTRSRGTFESNLLWNAEVLLVGAVRNWGRTVLLWNLALDEEGGPRVGGCPDCRGVVTIDPITGDVTLNEEYFALAHLGRAVGPAAVRIGSTETSDGLANVAFRNPDGSLALVVVNSGSAATDVRVRAGGRAFDHRLAARSVATYTWPG